jgi:hypothetical protein
MRLGCILEEPGIVQHRGLDRVEVRHRVEQVHRDGSLDLAACHHRDPRGLAFDVLGIEAPGPPVNIAEDRRRSGVADGVRRGDVAERGHQDEVVLLDAERQQRQVQRRRTARAGDGELAAAELREGALEATDVEALRQPSTLEAVVDIGLLVAQEDRLGYVVEGRTLCCHFSIDLLWQIWIVPVEDRLIIWIAIRRPTTMFVGEDVRPVLPATHVFFSFSSSWPIRT